MCTVYAAQECPRLSHPDNGKVYIIENDKIALYVCDDGFNIDGSHSLYCVGDKWSSPPPVCQRQR